MPQSRPILIASDLSPTSDLAVTRGLQLAADRGSPVIVLHVIREEPLWWVLMSEELDPNELRGDLAREAQLEMRDQVRQGGKRLGIELPPVDTQLRWGRPAATIAEVADELGAALVVAGSHGAGGVGKWMLGSTAEKLVRTARCPVLTVREPAASGCSHVVVAVDFSPASRDALAAALEWGGEASLTLVHAYETWFESYISPTTYERLRREQEKALHERLRALVRDVGVPAGHEIHYRVVAGLPGRTVVDVAEALDADLTVCGTQGETGLRHLLLGSVAQHILRESRSDVMTVRARGEATGDQ